jgi:hypothetical protein
MRPSLKLIRIPIVLLHGYLLYLFPARFRMEFAGEIREIFLRIMLDAEPRGGLWLLKVSVREITALMSAILREHWHEFRIRNEYQLRFKDWRWGMSDKNGYKRRLLFTWVFANILGFSIPAILVFGFPSVLSIQEAVVTAVLILIPGLAQWLALRRFFRISILWVLSIPIGFALFYAIYGVIPEGVREQWDETVLVLTVGYIMMGLTVGLPQWLILRRHLTHSSIWLLGSSAGVGLGFWIILATDLVHQSGVISFIIAVLVYPIATGLILSSLNTKHDPSQVDAASAA